MPCPRLKHLSILAFARGGRRNVPRLRGTVAAFLALGAALGVRPARAQEPVSITPRRTILRRRIKQSNIRMDVNLVFVPVTVTDSWDRPVTDLNAGSFRIYEDNIEQKIVSVFEEDGPVSVGLLLDTSSSMRRRIDRSITAIGRFFQSTRAGDEFFLVRFADHPALVTGFTPNPQEIVRDLPNGLPQGWTALLDAVGLGVHEMKKAKNSRKALIVLTDGGDNNSRYTESEIKDLVMESDVRIYAIGISEQYRFLDKLASESGGKGYFAHKLDDLPGLIDRLSKDLREEYVLGYSPNNRLNDGKYRTLKVEVIPPGREKQVNVVWRRGYYAPPD
jgi:Ca-activated chloride channel family protein